MNDGQGPTPAEVYKKAQEFGIEKKHKTLLVLMQNLFTENVVKEIERFAPVLSKVSRWMMMMMKVGEDDEVEKFDHPCLTLQKKKRGKKEFENLEMQVFTQLLLSSSVFFLLFPFFPFRPLGIPSFESFKLFPRFLFFLSSSSR